LLWVTLPVFYGSPPRRCVRCGQLHAGVCGVGGRRQNKCCGEYKRGQPPAFGRAGNSTTVCLRVELTLAVVSRVSVTPTSVRGLQPRPSYVSYMSYRSYSLIRGRALAYAPACPLRWFAGWYYRWHPFPASACGRHQCAGSSHLSPFKSVRVRSCPFEALIRATAAGSRVSVPLRANSRSRFSFGVYFNKFLFGALNCRVCILY